MCYIWEEKMHKSLWQFQNSVRRYGVAQLPIPVRRPRHIGPITLASDTNANLPLGWRRLLSHLNVAETQSSANLHFACPPAPAGRASMPTSQEQSPDMSLSRPLEPASGSLQVTCWSRILRQWHKSAHRVVDGSRASPAMSADRAVALPAAAVTPVLPSPAVTPALPVPLSPRFRKPRHPSRRHRHQSCPVPPAPHLARPSLVRPGVTPCQPCPSRCRPDPASPATTPAAVTPVCRTTVSSTRIRALRFAGDVGRSPRLCNANARPEVRVAEQGRLRAHCCPAPRTLPPRHWPDGSCEWSVFDGEAGRHLAGVRRSRSGSEPARQESPSG